MDNTLENWIKFHEGYRSFPYTDTVGKLTIGYGRNLSDKGISFDEAMVLLRNDISSCTKELSTFMWYNEQPPHVKDALVNMCFNLGLTNLLKFKRMIKALEKKDYTTAAKEALDSKWATQVPNRAKDIALVMRQGFAHDAQA